VVSGYVGIWIGYANIFIATFIMVYAYLFLQQTNEHRDRRPWDLLFMASLLYFIYNLFNILLESGVTTLLSNSINVDFIGSIFAFLYSGCVLLAFVSQHDLILRSQLILISKKDHEHKEAEKDVEMKIGFDTEPPKPAKAKK
jgi:hypothetical protein